tara:strand:+ start:583 stop:1503 length:921 start_codon:yes stop_codon:yes gene_type:complete
MALKIIFMGTPEFAVPVLKAIYKSGHKILEVYTQPAKKKDRGQKIKNSPIHDCAEYYNLKVRCPVSLEANDELDHFIKLKPDLVIVVAYGKILPNKLLDLVKIPFINVHASILPKWRGAAPIQRSIMNMDNETGVSIMKIIPKLDAGPILMQSKIKINRETTFTDLSNEMSKLGAKLIIDTLECIENNNVSFTDQKELDASYARKIEKSEAKISWNVEANKIVAKINALNPNPGCWFELQGGRVKIIKAKETNSSGEPGKIIDNRLTIACLKNSVQILELKKEGKQKMTAEEFLRGHHIKIGQKLI